MCCTFLPQTLDGKVEAGPPGLWKLTQHVQQQEEQLAATKAALAAAQVRRWVSCGDTCGSKSLGHQDSWQEPMAAKQVAPQLQAVKLSWVHSDASLPRVPAWIPRPNSPRPRPRSCPGVWTMPSRRCPTRRTWWRSCGRRAACSATGWWVGWWVRAWRRSKGRGGAR